MEDICFVKILQQCFTINVQLLLKRVGKGRGLRRCGVIFVVGVEGDTAALPITRSALLIGLDLWRILLVLVQNVTNFFN